MAGYIGSSAAVSTPGTERKKTFAITTSTTSLTGLVYTVNFVHVYHNGIRLVDGTDFTATNGTSITLTNSAENGDEVVVVSYATFSPADSVPSTGGTFSGDVTVDGTLTSDNIVISRSPGQPFVDFDYGGSRGSIGTDGFNIEHNATQTMLFKTNSKTRMSMSLGGDIGFYEDTGNTAKFYWNASAERLGIGTDSPAHSLHVEDSSASVAVISDTSGNSTIFLGDTADHYKGRIIYTQSIDTMKLLTNGSEACRIDSSGNLLVGKSVTTVAEPGLGVFTGGLVEITRDGDYPLRLNRKTSDGTLLRLDKDGTTVGSIAFKDGGFAFAGAGGNTVGITCNGNRLLPTGSAGSLSDNAKDIGHPSYRWDDVYATNGTIQTSDANEKQQIAALTDAEMTAAKAISAGFKTFKWNDSVAEKGADAARTHSGVIAQEVEQAMTDAGLDAGDYAFFISTTWWETQTDVPAVEADEENGVEAQEAYTRTDTYDTLEEAPEGATERNRKGIRYPQLLSFVGAATEQRLASIEARLAALEAV